MRTCLSCNASFADGLGTCPSCGGKRSYLVAGTTPGASPAGAPAPEAEMPKNNVAASDPNAMTYRWAYVAAPLGCAFAGARIALRSHADTIWPAVMIGFFGGLLAAGLLHGYDVLFKRGGY